MRGGGLRHRLTIERKSITQNELGDPVESWSTFAQRWASVEPLRGREFFDAQQVNAEITVRFRLRYTEGVAPEMRVNFDGRLFDVRAVVNVDERKAELILMCSERV